MHSLCKGLGTIRLEILSLGVGLVSLELSLIRKKRKPLKSLCPKALLGGGAEKAVGKKRADLEEEKLYLGFLASLKRGGGRATG